MKSGFCPKCASDDIRVVSKVASEVAIAINWLNTAFIDYHVCANRGFVEMFVQDKATLPKIAEKFRRVN